MTDMLRLRGGATSDLDEEYPLVSGLERLERLLVAEE